MSSIGTVSSLWRYPVKGMQGEALSKAFLGFSGVYGDRLYAFRNPAGRKGFPYFTAREQRRLLLFRPGFRYPDRAAVPVNLPEAQSISPGANPISADPQDLIIDVEAPTGETFPIDDPALLHAIQSGPADQQKPELMRSDRGMTDCRPVSLFSVQTADQLTRELGTHVDPRRFRANIYLDLSSTSGFAEDELVGRSIRIGSSAVIAVLERDPRCVMISLDPDTAEANPDILRQVAQAHGGSAGVYGAMLAEGLVRTGDPVTLLD